MAAARDVVDGCDHDGLGDPPTEVSPRSSLDLLVQVSDYGSVVSTDSEQLDLHHDTTGTGSQGRSTSNSNIGGSDLGAPSSSAGLCRTLTTEGGAVIGFGAPPPPPQHVLFSSACDNGDAAGTGPLRCTVAVTHCDDDDEEFPTDAQLALIKHEEAEAEAACGRHADNKPATPDFDDGARDDFAVGVAMGLGVPRDATRAKGVPAGSVIVKISVTVHGGAEAAAAFALSLTDPAKPLVDEFRVGPCAVSSVRVEELAAASAPAEAAPVEALVETAPPPAPAMTCSPNSLRIHNAGMDKDTPRSVLDLPAQMSDDGSFISVFTGSEQRVDLHSGADGGTGWQQGRSIPNSSIGGSKLGTTPSRSTGLCRTLTTEGGGVIGCEAAPPPRHLLFRARYYATVAASAVVAEGGFTDEDDDHEVPTDAQLALIKHEEAEAEATRGHHTDDKPTTPGVDDGARDDYAMDVAKGLSLPNGDGLRAAEHDVSFLKAAGEADRRLLSLYAPPSARTRARSGRSEAEQIDHENRCEALLMLSLTPMRAKCEPHVRCSSINL